MSRCHTDAVSRCHTDAVSRCHTDAVSRCHTDAVSRCERVLTFVVGCVDCPVFGLEVDVRVGGESDEVLNITPRQARAENTDKLVIRHATSGAG